MRDLMTRLNSPLSGGTHREYNFAWKDSNSHRLFATGYGHNEKTGDDIWSSSELPDPVRMMNYLPSTDVRKFIKEEGGDGPRHHKLQHTEAYQDRRREIQFIAYGRRNNASYSSKAKTESPWNLAVCQSKLKSTGMTPLTGAETEVSEAEEIGKENDEFFCQDRKAMEEKEDSGRTIKNLKEDFRIL